MSSSQVDPRQKMRSSVNRVAQGEQAPRPPRELGSTTQPTPSPPPTAYEVIDLRTAPADFRFPTANQIRRCYTRYLEYHRCIQAKGKEAAECEKFARYHRSLCPLEWIQRWNEQRELGIFPGPL